ncbi:putative transmembrane protein [Sesbania bispinosa]|nr:putative transmembrane protein [Sesbania bispinosa]
MSSVVLERRDEKGWSRGNSLVSITAPPLQLVAIVGIVVFLLWVSSYMNYKAAMQTTTINVNLFLLFLPLVITLIAQYGRFMVPEPPKVTTSGGGEDGGPSPWGWVALVVLLLSLISYRLHPIFVVTIVLFYLYILSV